MKRINRRQFAKTLGAAALVAPLAPLAGHVRGEPGLPWPQEPPKQPQAPAQPPQQAESAKPERKLQLSKEQEEAVKKAVERRDRQLTALRGRTLAYDAEPAFVFQVRQRSRPGGARKG